LEVFHSIIFLRNVSIRIAPVGINGLNESVIVSLYVPVIFNVAPGVPDDIPGAMFISVV
jgi:hypothetical protein